jgi:hypothetical protein
VTAWEPRAEGGKTFGHDLKDQTHMASIGALMSEGIFKICNITMARMLRGWSSEVLQDLRVRRSHLQRRNTQH